MTLRDFGMLGLGIIIAIFLYFMIFIRLGMESRKMAPLKWIAENQSGIEKVLGKYNCKLTTNTAEPGTLWLINEKRDDQTSDEVFRELGEFLIKTKCPYGVSKSFQNSVNR
jgi:hypothetical protein